MPTELAAVATLQLDYPNLFPSEPHGFSLLGLPAERSAKKRLPGNADDVLTSLSSIMDSMIDEVIAKRTAKEFGEAVMEAFPKYLSVVMAFTNIVSVVVRRQTIERLSSESFAELEADLRDCGVQAFGEEMRERGIFTVWTLRKTSDLLLRLDKAVDDVDRKRDEEFCRRFLAAALYARFHVDCLVASMHRGRPIYPEVLPRIDDGLRAAVNAFAFVKQAVDLRLPQQDDAIELSDYWTKDDDELLDSSMADLADEE